MSLAMMPKSTRAALWDLLVRQEGLKRFLYECSADKWTIGVGHNIEDNGLPYSIIVKLWEHDVGIAIRDLLVVFPKFSSYSATRQIALISMMFQLGASRFAGFKKTIKYIKDDDWASASVELLDSKWARDDTPGRAKEISEMIKRG